LTRSCLEEEGPIGVFGTWRLKRP